MKFTKIIYGAALCATLAGFVACGGSKDEVSEEEVQEFLDEIGATGGGATYDDGYDSDDDYPLEDEEVLQVEGEQE